MDCRCRALYFAGGEAAIASKAHGRARDSELAVRSTVFTPSGACTTIFRSDWTCPQVMPGIIHILMRSFWQWLEHVGDDPSAADSVATLIAQAGAVGVSLESLRKVVRLSPESLDEVLKGLLASKQVVLLKVDGARVYRAM